MTKTFIEFLTEAKDISPIDFLKKVKNKRLSFSDKPFFKKFEDAGFITVKKTKFGIEVRLTDDGKTLLKHNK